MRGLEPGISEIWDDAGVSIDDSWDAYSLVIIRSVFDGEQAGLFRVRE